MTEEEFKAAFGLKQTSTDWAKLQAMMNKKWSEANSFVQTKVLPEDDQGEAEDELNNGVLTAIRNGNSQYSSNKQTGGTYIRDTVLPDIQGFLNKYRKIAKTTPKKVETDEGGEVEIYWTDIPGYEKMKPDEREQAEQEIAKKVINGKAVYDSIMNADDDDMPDASHKDAGDLVWALKTLAQKKNGPYVKGAMVVPGGEKLRKWLDSLGGPNGEVYPRSSSHLTEQQKLPGQQARGMDFYDPNGGDGKLPSGMNTMLYQQLTLPSGEKALYMKMETAAAFGTAKWNWYNGVKGKDPTMPPSRNKRGDDDQHADEHGDNYRSGKKEMDRELGAKREDVPKEVKQAWDTYLKTVTDKGVKAALKSAAGGKFRLNNVLMKIRELDIYDDNDQDLNAFLDVVEEKAGAITSTSSIDSRFGGEAVLTPEDLA